MTKNTYSVGQINRYIKNMFSQDFLLANICVKGEVSNCKYHTTGHIYFTLKDESGAIRAVMFRGNRGGLSFQMKEGDKVAVTGSVEVYERDGTYQLYAKKIELDGAGDLYQKFEALKRELSEMGMFAQEYKQPIPRFAKTVGIVTAKTGAAIQDIRNIAGRRNPGVQLILYPALVQGEGAAPSIVKGIRALDAYGVDVIIVGRGGGSIEDLWAFNEEIVARAIFDCRTPIVSAVGHETDWTIADFVADLRAPTPSAAAELCVFDRDQARQEFAHLKNQLDRSFMTRLKEKRDRLEALQRQLTLLSPMRRLKDQRLRLNEAKKGLNRALEQKLTDRRHRLAVLASRLEGASPVKRLESGFGLIESDNKKVKSVSTVQPGDHLTIHLKDGRILAEAKEVILHE